MNPKLTYSGQEAMLKALNGDEIHFTKIKLGNGPKPDDYAQLTDLQNPLKAISIEQAVIENHYAKLTGETISNADFESDFYWTELGIFVSDPEGGADDLLYAYAHYELSDDAAPLYIGASTSSVVQITPIVHVYVGDAENITAELSEATDYALKSELRAHALDTANPHGVTKAQVGLSQVPNVTTNNQTPTFSAASTLAEIKSGETMSTIMGKIKKAISSLISHIGNKSNPHSVTLSQVGAAAAKHSHSAADITAGTMSIARGGTGVTTKKDLANLARDNMTRVERTVSITLQNSSEQVIKTAKADIFEVGLVYKVKVSINAIDITVPSGGRLYIDGLSGAIPNEHRMPFTVSIQGRAEDLFLEGHMMGNGKLLIQFPTGENKIRSYLVGERIYFSY